jgi:hypothetical protein
MLLVSVMGHNIQNAANRNFLSSFIKTWIATLQAALHVS